MERMGINPGICKTCGGKMVPVEYIPDQFHQNMRAPPVKTEDDILNNWNYAF